VNAWITGATGHGRLASADTASLKARTRPKARPRNARGEPRGSGTAATAAEPALHILERKAMLRGPCLKMRDINRIG